MRIATKIILFFMLIAAASCGEYEADILDPRLPAYSETGQGEGGAYINQKPWRVTNIPASFYSSSIDGMSWRYSLDTSTVTEQTRIAFLRSTILDGAGMASIVFYWKDYRISNPSELKMIEGSKITLDNESAWAELILYRQELQDTLRSTSGVFFIRYVENVPDREHVIVSGTFGFEVESGDSLIKVSSGRYDFNVDHYNIRPF